MSDPENRPAPHGETEFWKTVLDGARRIFDLNPPRSRYALSEADYRYIVDGIERMHMQDPGARAEWKP